MLKRLSRSLLQRGNAAIPLKPDGRRMSSEEATRRVAMRKDRQEGRRTMNDQETDLVLGQVCVTLANLLLFGSTAAQTACFTDLVEMSRAKELSPYQRAALRSVADAISAYHAKVWEIEQGEQAEDPVPPDALQVGSI